MASPLARLPVNYPAALGLNSEATSAGLDSRWAAVLTNIVYDNFGRICGRKAFRKLTTTPVSGNPSMDCLFEYRKDSATTFVISVDSAGTIYQGTGTLTDITGSVTLSDTNLQFANFEGKVIGVGQANDPIEWDGTGNFDYLHNNISAWQGSTAYVLGDIVKAVGSPSKDYYFVCTTAGTTAGTEPSWNTTEGGTTTDNTATWTAVHYPKGRCILGAYGRVWILDDDRKTIRYSALGIPYDFSSTNGGGTIDVQSVLGINDDFVTAIATFNNNLVIFSRFNTIMYTNIDDPSTLAIVDQITGTGCVARDTIANIGNDIIFLSYQGLRTLARTVEFDKIPMYELSQNIRGDLIADITTQLATITNDDSVKSVYAPVEGFYLLKLNEKFLCFDFKKSFTSSRDFTIPRVSQWDSLGADSMAAARDGSLYLAKGGAIGDYSGYDEWGLSEGSYQSNIPYLMSYRSAWVDMSEIDPSLKDRVKILKKITGDFIGGTSYDIDITMAFDFSDNTARRTITLPVSEGTEWGVGEWSLGEWSGSTEKGFAQTSGQGMGDWIQFGLDVNIQGSKFCIQNLTLFVKLGRIARGSERS